MTRRPVFPGCHRSCHPSAATHEGMGMRLAMELQARLGW